MMFGSWVLPRYSTPSLESLNQPWNVVVTIWESLLHRFHILASRIIHMYIFDIFAYSMFMKK